MGVVHRFFLSKQKNYFVLGVPNFNLKKKEQTFQEERSKLKKKYTKLKKMEQN